MQNKHKTNWLIDAALFGGFVLAQWLDLTGLALHQWLGVAVGAVGLYHLAAHWRWVSAVTGRFFGRTSRQSRLFYAVDAGMAIGFTTILATGLVISSWLDLALAGYAAWHAVHIVASVATLALVVAKIGLHWRWIVDVACRRILPAPAPRVSAAPPAPMAARVGAPHVGRRDFIRLMAGVGAVALVAGVQGLDGLAGAGAQAEAATAAVGSAAQTTVSTATQASAALTSSTSTCRVRCNKRCSYPGHCRKYTDSNGNGRCDLGECIS